MECIQCGHIIVDMILNRLIGGGLLSPSLSSSSLTMAVRSFAVCQPGQYGSRKERHRRMGDTLNPSLWKWYHRHGYWATRRKILPFMKKRQWRYHETVGLGKADPDYVARFNSEPSRYRPFKNYCRF